MKQYLMALTKRGIRPASRGNPPILDSDVRVGDSNSPGPRVYKVALKQATGNGGALAFANPLGVPCLVTGVALNVKTGVDTRTLDIGVAANGTTSSDTLFDGLDIQVSAQGVKTNALNGGTNGKAQAVLGTTQFITGTASGAVATLVADIYITLTPLS